MSAVQPEPSSNLSVANGRPIEALQAVPDSYTIRRKPLQGALESSVPISAARTRGRLIELGQANDRRTAKPAVVD